MINKYTLKHKSGNRCVKVDFDAVALSEVLDEIETFLGAVGFATQNKTLRLADNCAVVENIKEGLDLDVLEVKSND